MLIWFRYVWIFSLHQLLSRHANSLHLEHRVHVSLHLTLSDAIVANGTDLRSCPKCRSFSENTRGFQKEGNKHHQHVNEIHQQKNKFRGNPLRTRKIHSPFFPQNGMLMDFGWPKMGGFLEFNSFHHFPWASCTTQAKALRQSLGSAFTVMEVTFERHPKLLEGGWMKQGYDQNYTNKNGAKYNKYTVNICKL